VANERARHASFDIQLANGFEIKAGEIMEVAYPLGETTGTWSLKVRWRVGDWYCLQDGNRGKLYGTMQLTKIEWDSANVMWTLTLELNRHCRAWLAGGCREPSDDPKSNWYGHTYLHEEDV